MLSPKVAAAKREAAEASSLMRANRHLPASGSLIDSDGQSPTPGVTWDFGKISVFSRDQAVRAQAKLEVGAAEDPLELEADHVAEQVQRKCSCGGSCDSCKAEQSEHEHGMVQRKAYASHVAAAGSSSPSTAMTAPPIVHEILRTPGQPLDAATRGYFEPRFGCDFSQVRVHIDDRAADSARALHARAYTAGSHVVLARDLSASAEGRKLLAHELTHVVQQNGATALATSRAVPLSPDHGTGAPQSLTVRRQPDDKDEEYIPPVAAPERQPTDPKKNIPEVLGRLDLDDLFKQNPKAKERVETVAKELELDPGLLAGSLYAETATKWMRTTGTIASEVLGLDDWFGDTTTGCDDAGLHCNAPDHDPAIVQRLEDIIAAHPKLGIKFADVKKTGVFWNTAEEKPGGLWKPRGILDADKSVAAWGVYIKMQENVLRASLAGDPSLKTRAIRNLEDLTPEQRLTIERLAANAGVGFAKEMFKVLAVGGDIPRTGGTRRDPSHAFRTAVLHMARAVHLDQTIFGRPSSDYRPPAEPMSHNEAAELYDMPWLKKLPEWITPTHY